MVRSSRCRLSRCLAPEPGDDGRDEPREQAPSRPTGQSPPALVQPALLDAAANIAPPGVSVHVYPHADLAAIPLFDEDLEQETGGGPEAVRRRREVAAANGLLIATPEYNQSIPGVLKNTLDWVSREAPGEVLAAKPVAVVGATAGRWGTRLAQSVVRQVLAATGARVLPAPQLYAAGAEALFDEEGQLIEAATRRQLVAVLAAFAEWIDLVGNSKR